MKAELEVLVFDDDYHVARTHALAVAKVPGYGAAREAHSRAEAVAEVARATPDLILLDMYLPDGTGLDVVREVASSDGPPPPDFLAVTAARDMVSVEASLKLGAFYYLVKPFPFSALREQLLAYRDYRANLERTPVADQRTVDSLYLRRGPRAAPTDRTLSPTMSRVLEIVEEAAEPISTAQVAESLGASRPTAQRYLAVLLRRRLIQLDLAYGGPGRPEHRYRRS